MASRPRLRAPRACSRAQLPPPPLPPAQLRLPARPRRPRQWCLQQPRQRRRLQQMLGKPGTSQVSAMRVGSVLPSRLLMLRLRVLGAALTAAHYPMPHQPHCRSALLQVSAHQEAAQEQVLCGWRAGGGVGQQEGGGCWAATRLSVPVAALRSPSSATCPFICVKLSRCLRSTGADGCGGQDSIVHGAARRQRAHHGRGQHRGGGQLGGERCMGALGCSSCLVDAPCSSVFRQNKLHPPPANRWRCRSPWTPTSSSERGGGRSVG